MADWSAHERYLFETEAPGTEAGLRQHIVQESLRLGIDPALGLSLAQQESGFNPQAVSPTGVTGVFQVTNQTGVPYGQTPATRQDPVVSTTAGLGYFRDLLLDSKGDVPRALMRYNGGTDPNFAQNVLRWYPQNRANLQQMQASAGPGAGRGGTPDWDAIERQMFGDQPAQASPQAPGGQASAPARPSAPAGRQPGPDWDAIERRMFGEQAPQTPPQTPPQAAPQAQPPTVPAAGTPAGTPTQFRLNLEQVPPEAVRPGAAVPAPAPAPPGGPTLMQPLAAPWIAPAMTPPTSAPMGPAQLSTQTGRPAPTGDEIEAGLRRDLGGAAAQTLPAMPRRLDPRSMDDTALLKEIGVDPAVVTQSKFYRPGMFQQRMTTPESAQEWLLKGPLGSLAAGFRMPLDAGVQGVTRGLRAIGVLGDADVALVDAMIRLDRQEYEQTPRPSVNIPVLGPVNPAEMAGQMAFPLPGTKGVLPIAQGTKLLPQIAKKTINATVAGGISGATQPVYQPGTPGTPDDTFWQQKAAQTGTGAVIGGGTGAVTSTASGLGQKLINARQMGSMTGRVEEAGTRLEQEMVATPYQDVPQIQAAAARGDRRASQLLQDIQDAGEDWQRIAQTSGGVELFQRQQQANRNYATVERLAQPLGNVPVPRTIQAIDDALTSLRAEKLPDQATIARLEEMRADLLPTTRTVTVPPPRGSPLATQPTTTQQQVPPDNSYQQLRGLRSKIGDLIEGYYRPQGQAMVGTVGIGKEGLKVLPGIRQELDNELTQFAQNSSNPQLAAAARDADRYYATQVAPYHDKLLANAFKNSFSDEVYQQFIKQGKGERAQYYYDALDPKGQAAVRYGIVQEAYETALDPATNRVDTTKFVKYLRDRQEATGVFFQGAQADELIGVRNLLQHDAKLKQAGKSIPGIPSLLLPGGGYWSFGPVGGALGTGAMTGLELTKLMLSTERGRRFFMAASNLQPGSSAFARELQATLDVLPRALATQETHPEMDRPAEFIIQRAAPAGSPPYQPRPRGAPAGRTGAGMR